MTSPLVTDRRGILSTGLTPAQLRGPAVTRLSRDRYVLGPPDETDRWRAQLRSLPAGSALSHGTAARALGLPGPWRPADAGDVPPIHLTVPSTRRLPGRRAGLVLHTMILEAVDVRRHRGLLVTTPERTWLDLAATADPEYLLVLGDAVLAVCPTGREALAARLAAADGRRGVVAARRLLPHLDGRSQSPPESILRWRLHRAGLTTLVPQCPVVDGGRQIGRVDLGDPVARVGVEYEGRHHAEQGQFGYDLRRYSAMTVAGWAIVRASAVDLGLRGSAALISSIRRLLSERS